MTIAHKHAKNATMCHSAQWQCSNLAVCVHVAECCCSQPPMICTVRRPDPSVPVYYLACSFPLAFCFFVFYFLILVSHLMVIFPLKCLLSSWTLLILTLPKQPKTEKWVLWIALYSCGLPNWSQLLFTFMQQVVCILESPLGSKEIRSVHPNGNQPWIFIGRTDAKV